MTDSLGLNGEGSRRNRRVRTQGGAGRFSCKKCSNTIPVEPEEIVRNASSIDEAFTNFNAFAKTVEPRTIKCQCGHEDEYDRRDVILVAADHQPGFRRFEKLAREIL